MCTCILRLTQLTCRHTYISTCVTRHPEGLFYEGRGEGLHWRKGHCNMGHCIASPQWITALRDRNGSLQWVTPQWFTALRDRKGSLHCITTMGHCNGLPRKGSLHCVTTQRVTALRDHAKGHCIASPQWVNAMGISVFQCMGEYWRDNTISAFSHSS